MGMLDRFFPKKEIQALADTPPAQVEERLIIVQQTAQGKSGTNIFAGTMTKITFIP
jgi:hypothetical protein